MPDNETVQELGLDEYKYHFVTDDAPVFKSRKGLDEEIVRQYIREQEEEDARLEQLNLEYPEEPPSGGS